MSVFCYRIGGRCGTTGSDYGEPREVEMAVFLFVVQAVGCFRLMGGSEYDVEVPRK